MAEDREQLLYAAGYHRTPARLAAQRLLAFAVMVAAMALCAVAVWGSLEMGSVWPAAAGLVLLAGAGLYSWSIVQDVENVRRQLWTEARRQHYLWRQEIMQGRDLDGDGEIGEPAGPAARTMRVNHGERSEEIVLDMPARSMRGGPVLVDFGVTAADLVSFLFEADLRRGLQERNWVGGGAEAHVLPSGQRVTQAMFRQLVAGLAERGLASKSGNRWQLDCDPATVAEQLM